MSGPNPDSEVTGRTLSDHILTVAITRKVGSWHADITVMQVV